VLRTRYYSDNQIKNHKEGGTCETLADTRGEHRILVVKTERQWPFGKSRPICLKELG
jgi:hypothetical protein